MGLIRSLFYASLAIVLCYHYDGAWACDEDELARQCSPMGEDYFPSCDLETCDECRRVCYHSILTPTCAKLHQRGYCLKFQARITTIKYQTIAKAEIIEVKQEGNHDSFSSNIAMWIVFIVLFIVGVAIVTLVIVGIAKFVFKKHHNLAVCGDSNQNSPFLAVDPSAPALQRIPMKPENPNSNAQPATTDHTATSFNKEPVKVEIEVIVHNENDPAYSSSIEKGGYSVRIPARKKAAHVIENRHGATSEGNIKGSANATDSETRNDLRTKSLSNAKNGVRSGPGIALAKGNVYGSENVMSSLSGNLNEGSSGSLNSTPP